MRAKHLTAITIVVSFVALALLLWLWNRTAIVREDAMPDHFRFGKVSVGSKIEFSARFLDSSRKHPFDAVFERVVRRAPQAWSPALSKLHPKNFRKAPAQLDLSKLKPVIETPRFVHVEKVEPDQRTNSFSGWPFVGVHLSLDTARPGDYSGVVTLTLGHRRASLPIHVTVQEKPAGTPKLLIASTPYERYATVDGSNFYAATLLLSSLPVSTDYLHALPADLGPYQIVLLADSALARLTTEEISRVRSFAERGGRLVLACNAFMSGSVPKANLVLTNRGLQVVDDDYGRFVTATNLTADALSLGVQRVEFHRPSLIQVTDEAKAKAIVLAPDEQGSFVAVSRFRSGGEITVLTASLWWHWLGQFQTNSGNLRLMQNILVHGKSPEQPDGVQSP